MDWFDLLAIQGTLRSLLQHHSFKSINSSVLSLCGPTLTSIHDYWKNHSFDYVWESPRKIKKFKFLQLTTKEDVGEESGESGRLLGKPQLWLDESSLAK